MPLTAALPSAERGSLTLSKRAVAARGALSVYSILQLGMDRTYDIEPAKNVLGYRPAADGLARAFR